VNIAD